MVTQNIQVDRVDGWRSITCTGTVVHIAAVINSSIRVRLGIGSTSDGFVMEPGDSLSVNETLYVIAHDQITTVPASLIVIKD